MRQNTDAKVYYREYEEYFYEYEEMEVETREASTVISRYERSNLPSRKKNPKQTRIMVLLTPASQK